MKNLGLAETKNQAQNALPRSGGEVTGDITISTDSEISWRRNTDMAAIGFKNTGDGDTDSYMWFKTGDNGNEYFKWQHSLSGGGTAEWMSLDSDNLHVKGHQVYHEGHKPTAEAIQAEPRFNTTIDLTGLSSDRYYPVWWRFPSNDGANSWLTIHRSYAEDRGDKNPFGKDETHLAGLLLQIEGGDSPWGGDAHYLNIKRISQTYRKTVKNIHHKMMSIARPIDGKFPILDSAKSGDTVLCYTYSGCYLRGGLTYHITSNFSGIRHSREEGEVEIDQWSDGRKWEMKWMAKSYVIDDPILGKEYDDTVLPYAHDYAETINLAKNAYPITGGRLNGELVASNVVISQGDGRQHFSLRDNDGQTRAWIYKDKGGDGIHINNGYDGGGEWILNKSGEMYCPGTISSYLEHTIRHAGYGRINYVHQNTGDYILLETTGDGKGIYFVQRNKDNNNQWVLRFPQKDGVVATTDDIASTNNIPVGIPLPWPQETPPPGYLICNGESFDKAKCPQLALAYPSGVLPDLRGEFIRGLDAGRNVDSGRKALSWQTDEFRSHNHEFEAIRNETGNSVWGDFFGTGSEDGRKKYPVSNSGGKETRPRNVAFLYIVRAA
ncbi:e14 prophage; putative tail fiber protein (modular protein) (fragment) [Xenorhabdus bovienii str. Intermedium]|uniref:E14 prophage putative tail fiber protein (Modular protein) n=1 Tax=Xenorhabdus bovienii str. Intermedium TaxID=1379677 RepID=A0A077QG50_XENBV